MTTPVEPDDEHGINGVLPNNQPPWLDCGHGARRNQISASSPVESSGSDATRTCANGVSNDAKWALPTVSNHDSMMNCRQSEMTEDFLSRLAEKMLTLQNALGEFGERPGGSEPETPSARCTRGQYSCRAAMEPQDEHKTRVSFMPEDNALQLMGVELEDMISNLCDSAAQKNFDNELAKEELRELQTTCAAMEAVSARRLEEQQAALEESRIHTEELARMKTEVQCWETERDLRRKVEAANEVLAAQLASACEMCATASHEVQAEGGAAALVTGKVKEIERDLEQSRSAMSDWCCQATHLRVEATRERQELSKVVSNLRMKLAEYERHDKEKKLELGTIKQEVTHLRAESEKTEEMLHDARTCEKDIRHCPEESAALSNGSCYQATPRDADGARERQQAKKLTNNVRFRAADFQHKDQKKEQRLNVIREELLRNAWSGMVRPRKSSLAIAHDKNEKHRDHAKKHTLAGLAVNETTFSELKLELAEERRLRLQDQVKLMDCEQMIQSRCRNELAEQQAARDRVEESLHDEIRERTEEMHASETKNAQLQEAQANLELAFVRLEEAYDQMVKEKGLIERDVHTLLPWRRNAARLESREQQDIDDDDKLAVPSREAKKHDRIPNVNFKRLANVKPNSSVKASWKR